MIVGIDLGTTNCACAIYRNGAVEMIPNSLGHVLTPSAVSVDEKDNVLTGLAARERQSTHADRTVTAFKRYMGSEHVTKLGKHSFGPEELSALMLRSLKADAEAYLGEPVSEAIITVPAYFNNKQRKATKRAGAIAGLTVERLINEPTAAALAYGIHQRDQQSRFLVFDLGGGTFDVSIIEIFDGVIEVRASAGDNRLGGEDFNEVIIERVRRKFAAELKNDLTANELYQRLREAAERARRALSEAQSTRFSFVWKDQAFETEITADEFEQDSERLVARLREPVLRSMRDSNVPVASLDEIILVGGATRMKLVRKAVTLMFQRFPAANINPDEAVARGAAIQGALKARNADLAEVVLTDVCPYSLGVESGERQASGQTLLGLFTPILERNNVIPASREHVFSTMDDYQTHVKMRIYQGESRWVKDNIFLGELSVPVPRARAGLASIKCRLSYDINGLLEVDVEVAETGVQKNLIIADREGVSDQDMEVRRKALAKLKVHPRETESNKAALARVGRCYENCTGDQREFVARLIGQFEAVLTKQDPRECESARAELTAVLDQIEGQVFL